MAISSKAAVNITVTGCTPGFTANNDFVNVSEPGVAVVSVLANDEFSGPVTLHIATAVPPELTFDLATGSVTLQAYAQFGIYWFDYWLCPAGEVPANGLCSRARVRVRYTKNNWCYRVARGVFGPC